MSENFPGKYGGINFFRRLVTDLKLIFLLVKDFYSGEYRDVSFRSILLFVFMIAYIVFPLDIIPDAIPFLGQVDDAGILLLCIYFIEKDLYKYKEWKDMKSGRK